MYPLLTLRPLTTDIKELVGELAHLEGGLGDTSSLDTGSKDILVGRHVVGSSHAIDSVEVVDGRVVELELAGARDSFLDVEVLSAGKAGCQGWTLPREWHWGKEGVSVGGMKGEDEEGTYCIDWMVLEQAISLYESRSCSVDCVVRHVRATVKRQDR